MYFQNVNDKFSMILLNFSMILFKEVSTERTILLHILLL